MTTDTVPSGSHNLIIHVGRKTVATCTCGQWSHTIHNASKDATAGEDLSAEVCRQHALHLARARALIAPRNGDPP
jgi:hypothetical protein